MKGPDSVTELTAGAKAAVGALFAIAFVFLAFATYNGYAAAYGLPGKLAEIDRNPVQGLAGRLSDARRDVAAKAQRAIRDAVIATFFAVGLMAGAVAVTWFPPSPASGHVCLSRGRGRAGGACPRPCRCVPHRARHHSRGLQMTARPAGKGR